MCLLLKKEAARDIALVVVTVDVSTTVLTIQSRARLDDIGLHLIVVGHGPSRVPLIRPFTTNFETVKVGVGRRFGNVQSPNPSRVAIKVVKLATRPFVACSLYGHPVCWSE